jgi:molecular chaperone Hsp33
MEHDNTVKQAGGFIIQLMPFADEEVISKLENSLKEVTSVTKLLDEGMTPEMILDKILGGFEDLEILETLPTQFSCNCSKERIEKAIIRIGKKEITQMIQDGEEIEVKCHFCNTSYQFSIEELEDILKKAKR